MIKLHNSQNKQFYFTVCGNNGEVILTSETYKTKSNRTRAVNRFNKLLVVPMKVVEAVIKPKKKVVKRSSKHSVKYKYFLPSAYKI